MEGIGFCRQRRELLADITRIAGEYMCGDEIRLI